MLELILKHREHMNLDVHVQKGITPTWREPVSLLLKQLKSEGKLQSVS
jgi:hypothetical protein